MRPAWIRILPIRFPPGSGIMITTDGRIFLPVAIYSTGRWLKPAAAEALGKPLGDVSKMYLYHNNQDGTFTEVSREVGLDHPVFAMGTNFGDIDNDGWPDMYLGTGNPDLKSLVPNRLFKNLGGKKFADVTVASKARQFAERARRIFRRRG